MNSRVPSKANTYFVVTSPEDIRQTFLQARMALGIRQEELGQQLHLGQGGQGIQQRISSVERGATKLSVPRMLQWAQLLGFEVLLRPIEGATHLEKMLTPNEQAQVLVSKLTPRQMNLLNSLAGAFREGLDTPHLKALELTVASFRKELGATTTAADAD